MISRVIGCTLRIGTGPLVNGPVSTHREWLVAPICASYRSPTLGVGDRSVCPPTPHCAPLVVNGFRSGEGYYLTFGREGQALSEQCLSPVSVSEPRAQLC